MTGERAWRRAAVAFKDLWDNDPKHWLTIPLRQMLVLLASGSNNRAIAEALGTTEGSVKVYVTRLYRIFGLTRANDHGAHSRVTLARLFWEMRNIKEATPDDRLYDPKVEFPCLNIGPGGYICTKPRDHPGEHGAHASDDILGVTWPS